MKQLLLKAISEKVPVDIFFNVESNEQMNCVLFYSAFLVTGIDESKNTFIGYDKDERMKPIKDKVYTEENISSVCKVKFD